MTRDKNRKKAPDDNKATNTYQNIGRHEGAGRVPIPSEDAVELAREFVIDNRK